MIKTLTIHTLALLILTSCAETKVTETIIKTEPAKNCSVQQLQNGALLSCPDGTSAVIYNGENGTSAPVTFGIAGYIYPCGNTTGNREIFLRMTDNSILALYDGGPHSDRLTLLQPGSYVTTDNTTCNIVVDNQLNVSSSPVATTGLAQAL